MAGLDLRGMPAFITQGGLIYAIYPARSNYVVALWTLLRLQGLRSQLAPLTEIWKKSEHVTYLRWYASYDNAGQQSLATATSPLLWR
jgi:hypothetical protein